MSNFLKYTYFRVFKQSNSYVIKISITLQCLLQSTKRALTIKLRKVSFHGYKRDCTRPHCFFKRHKGG